MLRITLSVAVVAAIAASYGIGRYSRTPVTTARSALYYVDPMHPTYRSDKPGIAPDCGMQLEAVFADTANATVSSSLAPLPEGAVRIDGATQRLMGIRLAPVEKSGGTRGVRVVGRVVPQDTRVYRINSGVDGFIRETYSDPVGVLVKKDQKLATYYAPEFLSVASGFLAAVQGVPGANGKDGSRTVPFPGAVSKQGVSSLQGYSDRLRNIGMSDAQIQHVAESHEMPQSIEVVAPADGFILARNITPGQHFERNTEFYRIADLSRVWVVAEVSQEEASYLHPGGTARVTLRNDARPIAARIAESLPQSETGGGTVKLRLEVDNPGFPLRPDMLVDVEMPIRLPPAVTVPLDAVVDSGASARVYVQHSEGVFEPRRVETGWRFADRVEIRRGLRPGENVVASATFLVDSESRLNSPAAAATARETTGAPQRVSSVAPVRDPSCGMPVDLAKAAASGNSLASGGVTYYFCSSKCKQTFQNNPAASARRQGD